MTSSHSTDVVVVGAGVIGSAAAYYLSREGLSVCVLERGELAGQASGVAAGMLAPVAEAAHSAALKRWGFESLSRFPELCEQLRDLSGIDPEFEISGVLRVADSQREAGALRRIAAELGAERPQLGLEWLSEQDAGRLQPGLAEGLQGALWSPGEAQVSSHLFSRALAAAARAHGAQIEPGVSVQGLLLAGDVVTGVRTTDGDRHAGHVVVCTGCWAAEFASWIPAAFAIPVAPVRGQIVALDAPSPPLRSILWGGDTYVVPKRDGSVLVGATEERVGFDCRVTAEGVKQLLANAPKLLPALAGAGFRRASAGLRPGSPDGLPAIAPAPGMQRLALAVGHFRNGILLAPITGQLVTDIVLGKSHGDELADFDPVRWL